MTQTVLEVPNPMSEVLFTRISDLNGIMVTDKILRANGFGLESHDPASLIQEAERMVIQNQEVIIIEARDTFLLYGRSWGVSQFQLPGAKKISVVDLETEISAHTMPTATLH